MSEYLTPRSKFVGQLCSAADSKNAQKIILAFIDRNGRHAKKSDIIRATRLKKADLKDALELLEETGELVSRAITTSTRTYLEYIHVADI